MRSVLFQVAYWLTSILFVLLALPLVLIPSRRPITAWITLYTKLMVLWMRHIAGIRITVEGRERVPAGPCIIAAKHQSWGDGFVMFSQFHDLAFVTGDHLEKFPLVGGILKKLGAIVVKNCGGPVERGKLMDEAMKKAKAENRSILIYPEGHLSAIGERHRYRKGVYHMYKDYDVPVVPVATNLGLRWPQQSKRLTPGPAAIEFLDPIMPGLEKEAFMLLLEDRIETRSIAMLPKDKRPLITLDEKANGGAA